MGAGTGTGMGARANEGAQGRNRDGAGTEIIGRTHDGNWDGSGDGNESSSGDGKGNENEDKIGESGGEAKKHKKPLTRIVAAMWETVEIWVERGKHVENKRLVQ